MLKMKRQFAKFISFVLNPLVVITPVPYIAVLKTTQNHNQALFWGIFSLVFILIFFIFILIGLEKKFFSDFDISKRKERPLLYTFAIALAAIYTIFLYFLKAPEVLFIAIFGVVFGLITFELVNKFTKASIHVGTVAVFSTSIVLGYGGLSILSILLIPLVAWARIVTRNHSKRQTIIGGTLGILTTLVIYVIFKYII
jgi:hypothetical protein